MLMPQFHLAAYRGSLAAGSSLLALTGVADQALTRDASSNFLAPQGASIRLAFAGGTDIVRAQISTASLREVALPDIAPVNTGLTVPSPANLADFGDIGIMPRAADAIGVNAYHSNAGAQVMYAGLIFQFGRTQPRAGKEYRVRFTAAITGSAGTWQSGAITLDQTLPAGIYQVTGLDVYGTNLLAARLIFPGAAWRPGVLARNAVTGIPRPEWTDGRLGVYGEFNSVAMPQLETYVEAANTAQVGFVDLIRVGDAY